jgi:hypothetical protein
MCSIGPWLWGWGPWLERYVWFSTVQSARNWRRSRPIATARASIWSEHASCLPRRIGIRRSRWRIVSASADRRCSGGGSALPRAGSRVCCATRPASPARRRARGNHSAGGGADVHRAAALGDPPNRAGDGQIEPNTWHTCSVISTTKAASHAGDSGLADWTSRLRNLLFKHCEGVAVRRRLPPGIRVAGLPLISLGRSSNSHCELLAFAGNGREPKPPALGKLSAS